MLTNQNLRLVHDFSDTAIGLGDYIRLNQLQIGDLIYLKDRGFGIKVLLIGNATPFECINENSADGWDYQLYNQWKIHKIFRLELVNDGSWLCSNHLG